LLLLLLLRMLFTHLQVVNAEDVSAAVANHPPSADDLAAAAAAAARVEQPLDGNDRTLWTRCKVVPKEMKSMIWKSLPHGFSKYSGNRFPVIIICEQCASNNQTIQFCEIDYGTSKSTSNVKAHVCARHKQEYDAFLLLKASRRETPSGNMATFFQPSPGPVALNQRSNEIKQLLRLIVGNHLPIAIVESSPFRDYVKCLSPRAHLFSRKQIADELRTEFLECRVKAKAMFESMCPSHRAAVTVDHWTSVSNDTYACLTLHFITQSFELVNMPFNIRKMDGHTTGLDIAADVESMCAEVGVSPTCIVTDCEPAMVASWRHMNHGAQGCSDHRLEKVACKIFDSPLHAAALKKARKVAGHFHMSSQAGNKLREATKMVLGKELTTVQDVETRWWSTWACCNRLLQLKASLAALQQIENGIYLPEDCRLSMDEWRIIEVCVSILLPVMEAEITLEGEKYVTASLTIPLLFSVRKKLDSQMEATLSDDTRANLVIMMAAFNKRFGTLESTLPPACLHGRAIEGDHRQPCGFTELQCIASALDIRTKSRFWLPIIDHPRLDALILREAVKLFKSEPELPTGHSVAAQQSTPSRRQPSTPVGRTASPASFDAFSPPQEPNIDIDNDSQLHADCSRELLMFARVSQASGNIQETNPLDWWKLNSIKFPMLSKLARRSLEIPSTSGSSERLFSESGLVSTKKRNRLLHQTVEELVFLHQWYSFLETNAK
jgi:zinc finger BED domain-containing protein 1 (E3 SUMO-protein ligase ZBED1)